MVCKSAQIPPEIWMTLPLEAKKWILNERKNQQQEDDKMKKSLALSKSTAVPNDKETSNSNMQNQYARVKNVAKREDIIKENTDQTYDQAYMKQIKMLIMNIGHQTIMLMQHLA
jgi:hypothetical protein